MGLREIPPFRLVPEPLNEEAAALPGFEWAGPEVGTRHKLGGRADAVQQPLVYPACPEGGEEMNFYAQLDSISPESSGRCRNGLRLRVLLLPGGAGEDPVALARLVASCMDRDPRGTAQIVIELACQNRSVAYTLRARDPESLERISGLLHDQRFHLPLARREGDDYVIPFVVEETDEIEVLSRTWRGRPKRWRVPLYRAELRIANVEDVQVDDRGQIQTFTCVVLSHDTVTRAVELEAAQDAEIRVTVRHLDVVLSRSDDHAADDYRRSIFFAEVSGSPRPDPWPKVA